MRKYGQTDMTKLVDYFRIWWTRVKIEFFSSQKTQSPSIRKTNCWLLSLFSVTILLKTKKKAVQHSIKLKQVVNIVTSGPAMIKENNRLSYMSHKNWTDGTVSLVLFYKMA